MYKLQLTGFRLLCCLQMIVEEIISTRARSEHDRARLRARARCEHDWARRASARARCRRSLLKWGRVAPVRIAVVASSVSHHS